MQRVYIVEDDAVMADCLALAARRATNDLEVRHFPDALAVMSALTQELPDLILLDIILGGPDGFTLLNELMSYQDTAQLPIILVTSLDLSAEDLSHYGVVQILQKETMTPTDVTTAVQQGLRGSNVD